MKFKVLILSITFLLSSCSKSGGDDGPFKAYLILKNQDGMEKNFYLGGYRTIDKCTSIASFEAKSYDGDKFYTNAEFDYGGHKTEKIFIEHRIVGIMCRNTQDI